MEKIPKIITVMTKNDSSGSSGERIGSAVVPSDVRMDGVMMSTVIRIMNISITNMEPPGEVAVEAMNRWPCIKGDNGRA